MKHVLARNIVSRVVFGGLCGGVVACGGDPNRWPAPVEEGTPPPADESGGIARAQQASTSASWLVATGGVGLNTTTSDSQIGTDANSNFAIAIWVHGTRGLRVEPNAGGIPNLIGGSVYNTVTSGATASVVAGGGAQGHINTVTDSYGVVGGGLQNRAGNASGTVSDAAYAVVGGGNTNTASGPYSFVGGGSQNTASQQYATVGGGIQNVAGWFYTTCSGGSGNTANNYYATVAGGGGNIADGSYSAVGGGIGNHAAQGATTVAGGSGNSAGFNDATVGGGINNTASGAAVGAATVAGGSTNTATGDYSFVGGGFQNVAKTSYGAVLGGNNNQASGPYATVLGGNNNVASGPYSVAAGSYATADANDCFVWSDGANGTTPLTCGAASRFVARAVGGVYFYTNADASAGVALTPGANAWAAVSDRNAKRDFVPVNARDVLDRVAAMPVSTWTYKSEPGVRHMGPMAQDFRAAFGLGTNDKSIVTVDADGVALAAIKGVNDKVSKLEAESRALRSENQDLREQLEMDGRALRAENQALRTRLDRLEAGTRPAALAGMSQGTPFGIAALGLGLGAVMRIRRARR